MVPLFWKTARHSLQKWDVCSPPDLTEIHVYLNRKTSVSMLTAAFFIIANNQNNLNGHPLMNGQLYIPKLWYSHTREC